MKPFNIIVYDYETGSRNPWKTQPIQLAAMAIDGRKLEPIKGGTFNSLMKPIPDDKCAAYGVDPLEDEALAINKKDRAELEKAPSAKMVWGDFTEFVNKYSSGKGVWHAPCIAGFNNNEFDDFITLRLCRGNLLGKKEPYGFGPYDDKTDRAKLFNPTTNYDVYRLMYAWMRSRNFPARYMSLDTVREYLGMSKEGAHDAMRDVYDTAEILIRILRLHSAIHVNFENACAKGRIINV